MSKHFQIHRRASAVIGAAALVVAGLGVAAIPAGASTADTPPDATTTTVAPTSTVASTTTLAPTIECPAPVGNARFVRYAYFHILFRCPDAAGLAYWTVQMNAGLSANDLTGILDMSSENVMNNNVVPLYEQWLHRAPTAAEATAAAAMIRSEEGDAGLQAKLASSDEYYATLGGTGSTPPAEMNGNWLENVYGAVLDRDADQLGIGYFMSILGVPSTEATRHAVFMTLEHSDENSRDWTFSAYFASLGRMGDSAGLTYWSNWLRTSGNWRTFRMATYLMSSAEGQAIAQTQPASPPTGEH